MIVYHFIRRLNSNFFMVFALASFALGWYFSTLLVQVTYLYPLGLTYDGFSTLDYFPVFPWIGVYFTGIFLGRVFYSERKSLFNIQPRPGFLAYISRHSLLLYMVHQPIFFSILYLIHM